MVEAEVEVEKKVEWYRVKGGRYKMQGARLKGKNLEELNWALWPNLDSADKIRLYASIYNLAHDNCFIDPWPIENQGS